MTAHTTIAPSIRIEPIPGNPGYIANIDGGDPETDPQGSGATRLLAALDLTRELFDVAHPCLFLAVAAVIREDGGDERTARTVEGIA